MSKDGGAAFPFYAGGISSSEISVGMSLRDWFAGMAMQGLIMDGCQTRALVDTAPMAYRYADAMLAERERERQP